MQPRGRKPGTTVWMRIKEALSDAGLPPTQGQVAKMLGIKQGSVSEWNTPRGAPKMEHARALAKALGVCVDWLLNGVDPKRPRPDDPSAQRLWDLWPHLTDFTKGRLVQIAEDNGGQDRASFRGTEPAGTHRPGNPSAAGVKPAA